VRRGDDDIDELFESTCDDSIQYLVRARLWVDGEIVDQFRPGLRLRGDLDGPGIEPMQTQDEIAVDNGYLIEFSLLGDRSFQELDFFIDSTYAAEILAGGRTSAASACNDADDPGTDLIPSSQITHHDIVLDQI
jgi:hypothetical protein